MDHGCFRQYLGFFGRPGPPDCSVWAGLELVWFVVLRFNLIRVHMLTTGSGDMTPDNPAQRMCKYKLSCDAVSSAIAQIVSEIQRRWRVNSRGG